MAYMTFSCPECGWRTFAIDVDAPDSEHEQGALSFVCDNCDEVSTLAEVSDQASKAFSGELS